MISKEKLIGLVCLAFLGVAANFSMSAADSRAVSFNDEYGNRNRRRSWCMNW